MPGKGEIMRADDSKQGQHTPGPWKVGRVPLRLEVDESPIPIIYTHDGGLEIAQVRTSAPEPGERETNARLIAAAPELLEALHKIHSNAAESVEWIRRVADAAIAKAEGR